MKIVKIEKKKKNKEEIYHKQGKNTRVTGTLTDYHFFYLTDFLPCFFRVEFIPPLTEIPEPSIALGNIYPMFFNALIFTKTS